MSKICPNFGHILGTSSFSFEKAEVSKVVNLQMHSRGMATGPLLLKIYDMTDGPYF